MTSHIEEILRPDVDRVRVRISAVIQVDRSERIRFGQHVRDAVGLPGLHRRQGGGVVAPGAGILGAGMALRIERLIRRLLPAAVGCCVQRHTHHCGRSTSGAKARGSFVRSPWCVVGLLSCTTRFLTRMEAAS